MRFTSRALVLLFGFSLSHFAFAQEGWEEVNLGGETACALGAPYSFFVKRGSDSKVVIDFQGGGACWNGDNCAPGSRNYESTIETTRHDLSGTPKGLYDRENVKNPLRDATHLVVSYCTGDIHWGQADQNYTRRNGSQLPVKHRGAINAKAAIDWFANQYAASAQKVIVIGCSAGAYGSIYWTPYIRNTFQHAKFAQFGDSGAGILTDEFRTRDLPKWNIQANAPDWIPDLDPRTHDWTKLSLVDMYIAQGKYYPDMQFSQYNRRGDAIQSYFYSVMGGTIFQWSGKMKEAMKAISEATPNFKAYVASGSTHCVTGTNGFYTDTSGGSSLSDWFNQLVSSAD